MREDQAHVLDQSDSSSADWHESLALLCCGLACPLACRAVRPKRACSPDTEGGEAGDDYTHNGALYCGHHTSSQHVRPVPSVSDRARHFSNDVTSMKWQLCTETGQTISVVVQIINYTVVGTEY